MMLLHLPVFKQVEAEPAGMKEIGFVNDQQRLADIVHLKYLFVVIVKKNEMIMIARRIG